jgi:hypothetical protein
MENREKTASNNHLRRLDIGMSQRNSQRAQPEHLEAPLNIKYLQKTLSPFPAFQNYSL